MPKRKKLRRCAPVKLISQYESHIQKMGDQFQFELKKEEIDEFLAKSDFTFPPSVRVKIKNAKDLFTILAKEGYCDAPNFHKILDVFGKMICATKDCYHTKGDSYSTRNCARWDLYHKLYRPYKPLVTLDPVEKHNISKVPHLLCKEPCSSSCSRIVRFDNSHSMPLMDHSILPPPAQFQDNEDMIEILNFRRNFNGEYVVIKTKTDNEEIRLSRQHTCDVRLTVKFQLTNYSRVLGECPTAGNRLPIGRRLAIFNVCSDVFRDHDLHPIECLIKFFYLQELESFWRDYLNGSLLFKFQNGLERVLGSQDPLGLLLHVDKDDYERGRLILLQNND